MPNKSTKINLLVCENLHGKQIYCFMKKHYRNCTFHLICPDDIKNMVSECDGVTVVAGGIKNGECVYKGDMLTLAVFEKFGFYAEVCEHDVIFINQPECDADYQNLLRVVDYVLCTIGTSARTKPRIKRFPLIIMAAVLAVIFAAHQSFCEVRYDNRRTLFFNTAQYNNVSVIKNPCVGKMIYEQVEFRQEKYQFWALIDKNEYEFYPFTSSIEHINSTISNNAAIKTELTADKSDKLLVIISNNSITIYIKSNISVNQSID